MILEKKVSNNLTRAAYFIAATWMGILFITLSLLLCAEIINLLIPLQELLLAKIITVLSLCLSVIALINAQLIRIKKLSLPIKHLKKDLKLVQLTDLHLGTIHSQKFLSSVVKRVNKLHPDLVLITGDLFDGSAPVTRETIAPLNTLKAPVYYVIGNHEIYDGLDKVFPVVASTKAHILRNEKTNFKGVTLVGVDYSDDKSYLPKMLAKIKPLQKKVNILLYHAPPQSLENLEKNNISLHLAGHTHYGQIFPFNFLVRFAFPFVGGLYTTENTKLYIAPGTGTWGPPMRLGSRNEITLIQLKKSR